MAEHAITTYDIRHFAWTCHKDSENSLWSSQNLAEIGTGLYTMTRSPNSKTYYNNPRIPTLQNAILTCYQTLTLLAQSCFGRLCEKDPGYKTATLLVTVYSIIKIFCFVLWFLILHWFRWCVYEKCSLMDLVLCLCSTTCSLTLQKWSGTLRNLWPRYLGI